MGIASLRLVINIVALAETNRQEVEQFNPADPFGVVPINPIFTFDSNRIKELTNMNNEQVRIIKIFALGLIMLTGMVCSAWQSSQTPLKHVEFSGYAQGTTYHIIYYAGDSVVSPKQTDSLLKDLDNSVSLYSPASLICQFNRSEKGISIDAHFRVLIRKALEINQATAGAVDVTVKPLVDAWGFGVKKPAAIPGAAQIRDILKNVGYSQIWLQGNFLHKKRPAVQIDLNGIAQGYSADLLAALLEQHGISNYMVEIGGELRIRGHKPDGERFKIGIEGIDVNDFVASALRKVVSPENGAVTTSGNYRKYLEANGKRISHLMDSRTGYPVNNEMISVTVWAKDGITADGYDNGFMAMGLKNTLRFLEKRTDIGAYIIYRKDNGTVADTVTTGFKGYPID